MLHIPSCTIWFANLISCICDCAPVYALTSFGAAGTCHSMRNGMSNVVMPRLCVGCQVCWRMCRVWLLQLNDVKSADGTNPASAEFVRTDQMPPPPPPFSQCSIGDTQQSSDQSGTAAWPTGLGVSAHMSIHRSRLVVCHPLELIGLHSQPWGPIGPH